MMKGAAAMPVVCQLWVREEVAGELVAGITGVCASTPPRILYAGDVATGW